MADDTPNESLLAAKLSEAFGSTPPTPPDAAAVAETNVRAQRLAQLSAELGQVLLPTERRTALEAERDALLRQDFEARQNHAPEAVSPSTLTWGAGTEEPIKNAFSALAGELGAPRAEAQAVLDRLRGARWIPAEAFHAEMRRTWGTNYKDNLARVARELDTLHGPLKDLVYARTADETLFSPELAIELEKLPARRARGTSR